MRMRNVLPMLTIVILALLSISLKVTTARMPDTNGAFENHRAIDIVLGQAGFVPVGWHRLTNADAYIARVYHDIRVNFHCAGEVFVAAMPRNAEGVVLVEALAEQGQGDVFYLLNGEVRDVFPTLSAFMERVRTAFGNILGRARTTIHFAIASTHPCQDLRTVPWKQLEDA
ncbi:MAG: hypothetical protein V3R37_05545 [Rhodospirillales bacterium]